MRWPRSLMEPCGSMASDAMTSSGLSTVGKRTPASAVRHRAFRAGFHCSQTTGHRRSRDANPGLENAGASASRGARSSGAAYRVVRDLSVDAERNRIYLPRELLRRSLLSNNLAPYGPSWRWRMSAASSPRLRKSTTAAQKAIAACRSPGARVAALILATYRAVLQEIRAEAGSVWKRPIRLSARRKARLALGYALAAANRSRSRKPLSS